jgi:hypothetical protein
MKERLERDVQVRAGEVEHGAKVFKGRVTSRVTECKKTVHSSDIVAAVLIIA